MIQTQYAAV